MKYHKPQITSSREAVPAIRGLNRKVLALFVDSLALGHPITIVAYEADEYRTQDDVHY
jgi:hypothetical protein